MVQMSITAHNQLIGEPKPKVSSVIAELDSRLFVITRIKVVGSESSQQRSQHNVVRAFSSVLALLLLRQARYSLHPRNPPNIEGTTRFATWLQILRRGCTEE